MEDVLPSYEWVLDKDMMTTSEAGEVGKLKVATVPHPGAPWVDGTLTPAVAKTPPEVQWGSIFVDLGSCIYSLGGVSPRTNWDWSKTLGTQTALKHVFFCDVARPEEGWKRGPELNCGRSHGSAVALNDSIYVFGGIDDDYSMEEWSSQSYTEVCHLNMGRSKSLSPPPAVDYDDDDPNKLFVSPEVCGAHPLPDGRILIHYSQTLISYNVQSDSFSFFDNNIGSVDCNAAVFLDDVLFFYRNGRGVYVYDVVNRKWFRSPVRGLRKGTVIPPNDEFQTFLLHLGGGRFCIVWSAFAIKNRNHLIIRSTVFRVSKKTLPGGGEPLFMSSIEACKIYSVEGKLMLECLAL